MGRKGALAIVFGLVAPLFGCGAVDSGVTYLPESFRQPAPKVAEIEQPPDVHLIVRNNISAIFMAAASPSNMADGQHVSRHRLTASQVDRSAHKPIWCTLSTIRSACVNTSMTLIGAPRRPISHSDLTGRPKIRQSREPAPSIINETVADFTRVVEQTGILERESQKHGPAPPHPAA